MYTVLTKEDNELIANIENAFVKAQDVGYKMAVNDAVRLLRLHGQLALAEILIDTLIEGK